MTKKIVAIGGGTGLYTLISGLKNFDIDISAIVAASDDGGSSGILRDEYGILPPGDIRRCIVALSESEQLLRKLFEYRFRKGGLKGHSFGNLFITALREITGSFDAAVQEAARLLAVKGKVLPCTLDDVKLCALLENSRIVKGQVAVSEIKRNYNTKIKELFLETRELKEAKARVKAYKPAIRAIEEADLIVLGPGSLFTSVLPNLLIKEIQQTILNAKAKKVYVVNIMTEHGETNDLTASQHVVEVEKYLKGKLDYVILNTSKAPIELLKRYEEEYKVQVDADIENISAKIIKGDFLRKKNLLRHDSFKLAKAIIELVK